MYFILFLAAMTSNTSEAYNDVLESIYIFDDPSSKSEFNLSHVFFQCHLQIRLEHEK